MNVAVVITVITGCARRYDDGDNIVFVLTINDRIIN